MKMRIERCRPSYLYNIEMNGRHSRRWPAVQTLALGGLQMGRNQE